MAGRRDQRIAELEDLILQLDATLADLESSKRKGYLVRDQKRLRAEADRIYAARRRRVPPTD
jgi:hypothetical protein